MENKLQKLARLRAKRQLKSFTEQWKSIWTGLFVLLCFVALIVLPVLWIGVSNGEVSIALAVIITICMGLVGWFFNSRHTAWEGKQFAKLYEEELLELKLKK